MKVITKYAVNSAKQLPQNRFYGLWSEKRPPDSVRLTSKIGRDKLGHFFIKCSRIAYYL